MRLKGCANVQRDEAELSGAAAVLELSPRRASDEFQNEMVGGVPTEAAADVPGEIPFTVSGPVAGVVGNIVAAQSGSQQRRESGAQKVIFRVESAAKDERVVVEGQLRAAGVEGVKTTHKIQRYRPMVRDVIADTQAERGGAVQVESC